jgi:hypothetical protein
MTKKSGRLPMIRQQAVIKKFLIRQYGDEVGELAFLKQEQLLKSSIDRIDGKDKSQVKTLTNTILPRIALYQMLKECQPQNALEIVRRYMMNVIAARKHSVNAKMERVPFFFYIYRSIFLKIMRTTHLQQSTQKSGKGYYDITITKCLWHTACVENGCPELCAIFCDVDDVQYGGLKKMGFSRTQTFGYGGDCCDFHFYKK